MGVLAAALSKSENCVGTCLGSLQKCHKTCKGMEECFVCSTDNNGCNSNCSQAIYESLTKSTEESNKKLAAGAKALHKCTTDWTSCGTECMKDSQKLGANLTANASTAKASQQLMDCNQKCMKKHTGCLGALSK